MWKFIKMLIAGIAVSFYFFPFEFTFLPGVNTKMAMAGVGLIFLGYNLAQKRTAQIDKSFLIVSLFAIGVSLISFCAATINGTRDYAFVGYIVSMWVWLGGAYCAILILNSCIGRVDVDIVCNYLIAVCVAQCILAYIISIIPSVSTFVDTFLSGEAYMGANLDADDRMHGIGAALDPAGIRFAAVLVIIAFMCINPHNDSFSMIIYLVSFLVIFIIGNMIARTTTIGGLISIVFWIVSFRSRREVNYQLFFKTLSCLLIIVIPVIMILYGTNQTFYNNLRFGFEGFFSLAETGRWEVSSNDILFDHMIVFPDNLKTWIIGDGYAGDFALDPYYTGKLWHGFYMGTDIGYLRFIFYFGLVGLLAFVLFFIKVGQECISKHPCYKQMFILLLATHFIVWFKVSTDLFVVFALFLCLPNEDTNENPISDSLDI